jgi:hypothetical protein
MVSLAAMPSIAGRIGSKSWGSRYLFMRRTREKNRGKIAGFDRAGG